MLFPQTVLIRDRLIHKQPIFSYEFFPPKTEDGEKALWKSLEKLALLNPDFVSVTYGAGGSTRTRTLEIVGKIKQNTGIEPVAHLTCVGATKDEIARTLDQLQSLGIRNILALRGDPPRNSESFSATPGGFQYANELISFIRENYNFCIGAACYPEVHPEAQNREHDLQNLVRKVDAGVDFLVTQLFFSNEVCSNFMKDIRKRGIKIPVLAGIMPVTNVKQIERFTKMCGATIPASLHRRLVETGHDPQEVFWTGVSHAAAQCRELLGMATAHPPSPDAISGIHFYTLNRSPATRAIYELLHL